MKFKFILKYTFMLLCLAFVVERSTQCFKRFCEKPRGVDMKMSDGTDEILPHFTVCAADQYDRSVIEACGLKYKDIHGSNWVGDGPEYCKNPKLIMDKARVNLNQLIDKVEIGPINGIKELVYPQNQSYWKISHIKGLGFCYTFFIPDTRIKKEPIRQLGFQMKSSVNYMVHSPGSISKKDVNLYNITDIPLQNVILHYEVYHMLDYNNQPCQEDPHYLQDKCIDDLVFKESMERVNCTWPFVKNDNHICTEKESAKEARQIGYHISTSQKRSNCSHPCNYLKASFTLGKQEKYRNMIKFHFPESIKAHTAYFAYSILSLIAEVGGYVGLFLGWSIYQITDWLDLTIDLLKKKLYVS